MQIRRVFEGSGMQQGIKHWQSARECSNKRLLKRQMSHALRMAIALFSLGISGLAMVGCSTASQPSAATQSGDTASDAIADTSDNQMFEPFRDAINTAMKAAELTQTAATESDWRRVAQHWQTAIEMMKAVPPDHPKYAIAQQRASETYPKNFSYAQSKAGSEAIVLPTADDAKLTQIDFGEEAWPFMIDGELMCEQVQSGSYTVKLLTLHGAGHTFAVNGPAQARQIERSWQDIRMVWRNSPLGDGRVPMNWVIMRGEALC